MLKYHLFFPEETGRQGWPKSLEVTTEEAVQAGDILEIHEPDRELTYVTVVERFIPSRTDNSRSVIAMTPRLKVRKTS